MKHTLDLWALWDLRAVNDPGGGVRTSRRRANAGAISAVSDREHVTVVLEHTNLTEFERSPLYHLAERSPPRLARVEVTAPMNVVLERLRDRHAVAERRDPGAAADV